MFGGSGASRASETYWMGVGRNGSRSAPAPSPSPALALSQRWFVFVGLLKLINNERNPQVRGCRWQWLTWWEKRVALLMIIKKTRQLQQGFAASEDLKAVFCFCRAAIPVLELWSRRCGRLRHICKPYLHSLLSFSAIIVVVATYLCHHTQGSFSLLHCCSTQQLYQTKLSYPRSYDFRVESKQVSNLSVNTLKLTSPTTPTWDFHFSFFRKCFNLSANQKKKKTPLWES